MQTETNSLTAIPISFMIAVSHALFNSFLSNVDDTFEM